MMRFVMPFVVALVTVWGLHGMADVVGLRLTLLGWLNAGLIASILFWFCCDIGFNRRKLYSIFGYYDPPFSAEIRLWRKAALLLATVAGLVGAAVVSLPPAPADPAVARPVLSEAVIVLVGIFLASIGWIVSVHEHEKAVRASNTLQAIREQIHGDKITRVRTRLNQLVLECRKANNSDKTVPLDPACMSYRSKPALLAPMVSSDPEPTLGDLADQMLDAMDQLACGVRDGQLDFATVEQVIRIRFLRYAFVFHEYIRAETQAVEVANTGRLRAVSLTWEHFLWLVNCLEVRAGDQVSLDRIVLPPMNFERTAARRRRLAPVRDANMP